MKNGKELNQDKKFQNLNADKNKTSPKEGNKSQENGKKKDATTIEAEGTKSTNQDSKNEKPFLKK
jgi:hypothetical protein